MSNYYVANANIPFLLDLAAVFDPICFSFLFEALNCLPGNSSHNLLPSSLTDPSVQFTRSVVSDSLPPHESQHARPPCPSPTPRVHSDSCPSSQWCHPAISSSVVPFSSCPQSLPASESFPMSQLFAWGGQSTGVSTLASFLPKKSRCWLRKVFCYFYFFLN